MTKSKETVVDGAKTAGPPPSIEQDMEDLLDEGVETSDEQDADQMAKAKDVVPDDTWKENKDAEICRVFRSQKYDKRGVPYKGKIHTIMQKKSVQDGIEMPGVSISIPPNGVNQYVLVAGAVDYPKQLAVMRNFEDRKIPVLKEIDPAKEGIPWISPLEKKIQNARELTRKLIMQR